MSYHFPSPAPPLWRQLHGASADVVLRHLGVTAPPVDPFRMAWQLGAEAYQTTFERGDVSGVLDSRRTPPRIYVNAAHAVVRQRFSAAHELGHLLLHPPGVLWRDAQGPDGHRDPREAQANAFAADLLMPFALMVEFAQFGGPSALAEIFGVSREAMEVRWRTLKMQ